MDSQRNEAGAALSSLKTSDLPPSQGPHPVTVEEGFWNNVGSALPTPPHARAQPLGFTLGNLRAVSCFLPASVFVTPWLCEEGADPPTAGKLCVMRSLPPPSLLLTWVPLGTQSCPHLFQHIRECLKMCVNHFPLSPWQDSVILAAAHVFSQGLSCLLLRAPL